MKKGQISAMMLTVIGLLFSASSIISWNAFNKADRANEGVSEVKADVREIKTDVRWLREAFERNQKIEVRSLNFNTTSTKFEL